MRRVTSRLLEISDNIFSKLSPKFAEGATVIKPCIMFIKTMLEHIDDSEEQYGAMFTEALNKVRILNVYL
jgi:hypothetical protein